MHEHALALAARYGFLIYDAMTVAAAIDVKCTVLYS